MSRHHSQDPIQTLLLVRLPSKLIWQKLLKRNCVQEIITFLHLGCKVNVKKAWSNTGQNLSGNN